jgi:hypothetical protein
MLKGGKHQGQSGLWHKEKKKNKKKKKKKKKKEIKSEQ